jgi:amidase
VTKIQLPSFAIPVFGLPAISVPTSVVGGLPMGVQIVGPRFREDLIMDAAEVIEAHCPMPTPVDPRF